MEFSQDKSTRGKESNMKKKKKKKKKKKDKASLKKHEKHVQAWNTCSKILAKYADFL